MRVRRSSRWMVSAALGAIAAMGPAGAHAGCEVLVDRWSWPAAFAADALGYDVDSSGDEHATFGQSELLNEIGHRVVILGEGGSAHHLLVEQWVRRTPVTGWIAVQDQGLGFEVACAEQDELLTSNCMGPAPRRLLAADGNLAGLPAGTEISSCASGIMTWLPGPGIVPDIVTDRGRIVAFHCEPTPGDRFVLMPYGPGSPRTTADHDLLWRAAIEWAAQGPPSSEPCPGSNAELQAQVTSLATQVETLASTMEQLAEQNCELMRLVTTPEGQRSTPDCGGLSHRMPARPRR